MSIFSKEGSNPRKIYLSLLIIGAIIAIFHKPIGLGFIFGAVIALVLFERNVKYWGSIADQGSATKFTGIFHFLINYVVMAASMILAVKIPNWLNIIAVAVGLMSMKFTFVLSEVIFRKD